MSEVVEGKLDFDIVKTWMKSCSDSHVLCSQAQKPISLSSIRPYLIDVERMVVVKSKLEYVYAALSYVWGNEEDSRPVCRPEDSVFVVFEGISPRLPSRGYRNPLEGACKTVTDAIDLVKGIGIRYLWVDSYCISSDPVQRALHIKQMDKIYEGAWVTIVALSGTHENYGIPGLSVPLEVTPQPCVDLESGRFVASRLLEPLEDATSSPWNRRAWTMQEAALSKRCLCFTDKSVFWFCTENLQLDFVHAGLSRPDNHFLKFPFSVSGIENELRIENFREIMNQYSQR
ncbi:heterokaryon incompatibility protein-domain-containing protein [Leptodontidium sp. MPI-SDFR-AT-0119]|nr:heterokaryon incompatibility protein-domain-containing protein [Leptodontidium sp. MPI-SDFR-AT-0119]